MQWEFETYAGHKIRGAILDEIDLIELQTEFLLEFDKTESVLSFMSEDL